MKRLIVIALVMGMAAPALARPHAGGPACIDSYGTVIDGISSPSACQKLGARWGKPGTKSLPKEAAAPKASKHGKAGKREHARRYAHNDN